MCLRVPSGLHKHHDPHLPLERLVSTIHNHGQTALLQNPRAPHCQHAHMSVFATGHASHFTALLRLHYRFLMDSSLER